MINTLRFIPVQYPCLISTLCKIVANSHFVIAITRVTMIPSTFSSPCEWPYWHWLTLVISETAIEIAKCPHTSIVMTFDLKILDQTRKSYILTCVSKYPIVVSICRLNSQEATQKDRTVSEKGKHCLSSYLHWTTHYPLSCTQDSLSLSFRLDVV